MHITQKYILEDVSKASSITPAHIALINPDGTPALKAEYVDPKNGTVEQLINALIDAGLMHDAPAKKSNADAVPTEKSTIAEINAYAKAHGIDLSGANTKAEKLDRITKG